MRTFYLLVTDSHLSGSRVSSSEETGRAPTALHTHLREFSSETESLFSESLISKKDPFEWAIDPSIPSESFICADGDTHSRGSWVCCSMFEIAWEFANSGSNSGVLVRTFSESTEFSETVASDALWIRKQSAGRKRNATESTITPTKRTPSHRMFGDRAWTWCGYKMKGFWWK